MSAYDQTYFLDMAYERYVQSSALIGTPESCAPILDKLQAIGVDEIACFIDFGIAPEGVLQGLFAGAKEGVSNNSQI